MRRIKLFVLLAACLMLGACGNIADKITVNGYSLEKFKELDLSNKQFSFVTNLVLDAENQSGHNVELKECSAVLYNRRGHKIASAVSDDTRRHVLHKKEAEQVTIPLKVEFENAIAALTVINMNVENLEAKEYKLDYDCVVKVGPFSKRFREKGASVAELLEKLQK